MTNEEAKTLFEQDLKDGKCSDDCPECNARELAISALEKQIPKKPVNYDSVPHSRCPACKCAVKVFIDGHEYHYCLYCGQALDWSDSE